VKRRLVPSSALLFSRSLRTAEWANTTIAAGDTAEEVNKLRRGGDGHIVVWGGVSFWRSLMRLDLIDEFHLDLYPDVAGEGARLFDDVAKSYRLDPVSQHRVQQRGRRAAVPPAPLTQRPTSTTSGNQASATTCPRSPRPNSNQPAILAASPRSTATSRHRGPNLKAHHSAGHCLRRAVATSLIVHWRPQRCAPCQPDGLSPTAHRTRHDPSATSPKRTLNPHGDALHRQGSWLFGQDCRRLEIAVHPLIDPPLASLVEADRRPSCGNPQLLVTLPMCPPHKVREQKPSDTCSATVAPNDHAQQPRERSRRSSISN